ncbi:MFS transporter [Stackebrandtia nassauensis]|uniref:Major facilitator superfamily MFS_1 n=1 Tax=Stackebrandtia nassauensis (strain DSM 44728 / CIP 108903 / NRRL B-16338 / NBRC 102104 / LLR-40K-21) TaxID=446470 RepID=D3PVX3_STANL|nr:MFS transporter [Stackebrandtia nassauensis]ADD45094.1 major facilitator superfamily MFS_1 [Stackebrandtia nassauensis DSM 44728]
MTVIEAPERPQTLTEPATAAEPAPYRWRWAALSVIMAGSAMELLDSSVTSVAGPTMQRDLGGGAGLIQWLTAAYTLAMVGGLLIGARLGDIFGRRRMFLLGAVGFTITSLAVAVSVSPETAIAARVAQGLFGAAMVPQVFALIKSMFPASESQKAFGMAGPIMGAAVIGGPSLAGWLIGLDLFDTGWRMVFGINLPIGIAIVVLAAKLLPKDSGDAKAKLDIIGAGLASAASALLIYPLVQGREAGWPAWSFAMIAVSLILFGAFGLYQVRRAANGKDVLVIPSLFRKRAFNGGLVLGVLLMAAMAGVGLVMGLHLQLGLHFSPLAAAAAMIPFAVAMGGTMGFGDKLARFGRKTLLAGALLKASGVTILLVTLEQAGADLVWYQLIPGLMLSGIGAAMFMGRYFDSVMQGVEPQEIGSASGTLTSVQQLGASFGVAVLGTAFFGRFAGDLESLMDASRIALGLTVVVLVIGFAVGFTLPKQAATNSQPTT